MNLSLCLLVAMTLAIAPAAAWGDGASGAGGAEHGVRLAATLTGAGEPMALIAAGGTQAWLQSGDQLAACVLGRVDSTGAELECPGRRLRLRLDGAGTAGQRAMLPQGPVVLPPGWIESLVANPQGIALGLDLVPEADVAGLRGWRVARLDPESPVALLGIREHDLLLAVAGFPAADAGSLVAGMRNIAGPGSFNVTLQRAGHLIDLAVVIPQSDASP